MRRPFAVSRVTAPRRVLSLVCLTGLAALVLSSAVRGQGPPYAFTRIADSDQYPGLATTSGVGLNNQGTVVVAFAPTGSQFRQIWRGTDQSFQPVATQTGSLYPSINDYGDVAYLVGTQALSTSLVRNTGGTEVDLANATTPPYLSSCCTILPSLANDGSAVFVGGGPNGAGVGAGIYVAPSGPTVYDAAVDPPITFSSPIGMNNSRVVAFLAWRNGVSGIYRGSPSPLLETGAAVNGGPIAVIPERPVINDAGVVAFFGSVAGIQGVYTTMDGATVARVGSATTGALAINSSGVVAYEWNGGVYVGSPGAPDQKVIKALDALDGSVVSDVHIWPEAINDVGQIALRASLADGRTGIYRAEPSLILNYQPGNRGGYGSGVTAGPGRPRAGGPVGARRPDRRE